MRYYERWVFKAIKTTLNSASKLPKQHRHSETCVSGLLRLTTDHSQPQPGID